MHTDLLGRGLTQYPRTQGLGIRRYCRDTDGNGRWGVGGGRWWSLQLEGGSGRRGQSPWMGRRRRNRLLQWCWCGCSRSGSRDNLGPLSSGAPITSNLLFRLRVCQVQRDWDFGGCNQKTKGVNAGVLPEKCNKKCEQFTAVDTRKGDRHMLKGFCTQRSCLSLQFPSQTEKT